MADTRKEYIISLAEKEGIKKCGFSDGAFVALFPYYVKGDNGNVSMYARGLDYHKIIEEKLERIAEGFVKLGSDFSQVHVDKGKLNDRDAAFKAGLGFYGKNGMLICREFGSYFFIGQVTHTLDIEADGESGERCLGCGRCIKECIGGALSEDGFDIKRCVSEISQKRGELTEAEEKLIIESGLCWGCDRCQEVCPHNSGLETTAMPEFLEQRISVLSLSDIDGLTNREFKEKYGKYALSWRGKGVLIRNLNILSKGAK